MIADAGLQLLGQRLIEIDFAPPLDEAARRFVLGHLQRLRPLVAERLTAEDLAALDALPAGSVRDALTRFAEAVADRSS